MRFVLSDCDFDHVTGMQALVAPLALHASMPQRARLCSRPAFVLPLGGPGEAARKAPEVFIKSAEKPSFAAAGWGWGGELLRVRAGEEGREARVPSEGLRLDPSARMD